MHVHRTDPAYGAEVLSLADVDHLLTETAIRTPAVRVARNGSVLPESSFTQRFFMPSSRPRLWALISRV